MADLETEISETGCQTIIMSTESLFYPSVDPLKVRQYFGQFDVSICMTLRRQDEWLEGGTGLTSGLDRTVEFTLGKTISPHHGSNGTMLRIHGDEGALGYRFLGEGDRQYVPGKLGFL